ncbi:MAG: hypothetical protein L0226_03060 [Acidobacteria bacterium]|nr:hypothetical protein [Acidobacteriota bacterium]
MLATTPNRKPQLITAPTAKRRLLLVCDSAERLEDLKSCISAADYEINLASSLKELRRVCLEPHDLVALDARPSQIEMMLSLIRESEGHAEIPVYVDYTRIAKDLSLAGVLPYYRAMPCNRAELSTLLSKEKDTSNKPHSRRIML